ncbi:hypothetical protein C2S51_036750 [Perilla frutescens var. frutescens]|nr:hypothetical protein C2S51_036750 [Perilla frutescens var. frutescens]
MPRIAHSSDHACSFTSLKSVNNLISTSFTALLIKISLKSYPDLLTRLLHIETYFV